MLFKTRNLEPGTWETHYYVIWIQNKFIVIQGTAEKLLNENLSGHMLVELSYDDLKDVVGILQAKFVKKKVDEHLLDQETIFETNNPILKWKAEKQVLRKFGKDVEEGFSYIQGNYVPHETGAGSLLEPSREFKQFDGNIDSEDLNRSDIPSSKELHSLQMPA